MRLNFIEKIIYLFTFYFFIKIKTLYKKSIYTYYTYKKCRSVGKKLIVNGSIVTKDVPDYGVVRGVPAKLLKYRDIENFKKLKARKKFLI